MEHIDDHLDDGAALSKLVAQTARCAAYFNSGVYSEPGHSITEVDKEIGTLQLPDPLLTAHRAAKFYLISAGDCLFSVGVLIGQGVPLMVGSSALARSCAEHAARSMYLSEPGIDHRIRILRAFGLVNDGISEFKSTHRDAAIELVTAWQGWRSEEEIKAYFRGIKRQKSTTSRGLIDKYFSDGLAYDELSRPTHGNAIWLTLSIIQEQKQAPAARISVLRNVSFAIRCVLATVESVCILWSLDCDEVLGEVRRAYEMDSHFNWDELTQSVYDFNCSVGQLDERDYGNFDEDPHPYRP